MIPPWRRSCWPAHERAPTRRWPEGDRQRVTPDQGGLVGTRTRPPDTPPPGGRIGRQLPERGGRRPITPPSGPRTSSKSGWPTCASPSTNRAHFEVMFRPDLYPRRRPRGLGRAPPRRRRPLRRGRHRRRHPPRARHPPGRHRGLVPGARLRHPLAQPRPPTRPRRHHQAGRRSLGRSSLTPRAPAGRVPPAPSASAQVHMRSCDEQAGQDEGNVTERAQLRRIPAEYPPNMTHARGNRALVIGHRLVTHAAERAGIDPHHLTSSGASAQLRRAVAALASTGEHGLPLSLNQRVGGSIPSRRTNSR
jgi:hypothetical protein